MKAVERLLKYVGYPTGSDPDATETPSNPAEWDLARDLASEMQGLGMTDVTVDGHCYVMGTIPATIENYNGPTLALIAHIDVSSEAPFTQIKPQIVHYEGGDLVQDAEKGNVVAIDDYPFLANYVGCDIVTSDGSTLLGADDKAGVAEIMTLAERLHEDPSIKHGTIRVCFTPDEEIGLSSQFLDIDALAADVAYTVDGDALGEVSYETFNALTALVHVNGFNIHPGSAKNMMKNACRIACEFDGMIPDSETPEHTEGYEGFYHLCDMSGDVEHMEMEYIIRDHDLAIARGRGETMRRIASFLNAKYGEGTVKLTLKDSYFNMREKIEPCMYIVESAEKAMRNVGITPITVPIRGGTDGARLSFMGLPCPNLCTGGANFHSRFEYIPVEDMEKITDLLVEILTNV